MPKTKAKTKNKKHLAFCKFTYKRLLELPNNLTNIENCEYFDTYGYFVNDTEAQVLQDITYHAIRTGCLSADSISKEEYEKAVGVKNESNTQIQQK